MSYQLTTVLHLFGGFLLFAALGAMVLHQLHHGEQGEESWGGKARKLAGASHGLALLLLLITGFLLIVHLSEIRMIGGFPWPLWVWLKLMIWLLMGLIVAFVRRAPRQAIWLWWGIPLLGGIAAWLAIFKPWG